VWLCSFLQGLVWDGVHILRLHISLRSHRLLMWIRLGAICDFRVLGPTCFGDILFCWVIVPAVQLPKVLIVGACTFLGWLVCTPSPCYLLSLWFCIR
jgi:hypothetical protein